MSGPGYSIKLDKPFWETPRSALEGEMKTWAEFARWSMFNNTPIHIGPPNAFKRMPQVISFVAMLINGNLYQVPGDESYIQEVIKYLGASAFTQSARDANSVPSLHRPPFNPKL